MADANIKSKCADCIFFVEHDRMGECHRYPRVEQKFLTDFCGEFSAKPQPIDWEKIAKEPVRISEPVEIPKINVIFADPEPDYMQEDEPTPAKKRGRPFKK